MASLDSRAGLATLVSLDPPEHEVSLVPPEGPALRDILDTLESRASEASRDSEDFQAVLLVSSHCFCTSLL